VWRHYHGHRYAQPDPPTEKAEQVDVLGVVHQTNADEILPMAKRGAIGYKISSGLNCK
jgi:hypothetical protein